MSLWCRAGTVRRYVASRIRSRIAWELEAFTQVAELDRLTAERNELRSAHRALKADHEKLLKLLRQVRVDAVTGRSAS